MTLVESTTKKIVQLLVEQKFDMLEAISQGVRLSAKDMKNAIQEYGGALTVPPAGKWRIEIVRVRNSNPQKYSVVVQLWIDDTPSDLSLELTLIEANGNSMSVEIDDIHVL